MDNSSVIPFPQRPRRLRADVPSFDPANPAHIAAWESMWDLGQMELKRRQEHRHD